MKNYIIIFSLFIGGISFSQTQIDFTTANNNTTVNTCNGFIIDSGLPGGTGYGNNEDVTITICPDTVASGNNDDIINIIFSLFSLDTYDDNLLPPPGNVNVDQVIVYDGPTTAGNWLGTYTGADLEGVPIQGQHASGCITIRFISNSQNNVGNWMFSGSATCATPCSSPIAGAVLVNGFANDSIAVCVGDIVEFQENGSYAQPTFNIDSYEWDFFDGTLLNGSQNGIVQHAFDAPGHYIVNLEVTDDNNFFTCTNSNLTQLSVYVATPPTFYEFPSDTVLCIGESLDLVNLPVLFDSTWSGFPSTTTTITGCLSDDVLGVAQSQPIDVLGYPVGATITAGTDISSICIELEHSYMGDLVLQVQCPGGINGPQTVTLHQQGGGGTQIGIPDQADNVFCDGVNPATGVGTPLTYCFTPQATQTWVEWSVSNTSSNLPAGDYEPVGSFDDFIGCDIAGQWNLIVIDNLLFDDGYVAGWSIDFATISPDVVVFTPQVGDDSDSSYWDNSGAFITNISADGNVVSITPTAPGVYDYTYYAVDNFGCTNDSTVTVTVLDQLILTAGVDTILCAGELVTIGPEIPHCVTDGGNYTYCYGNNENTTFTYCPDTPGDGLTFMSIAFNSGSVSNFGDNIIVYDGQDTGAPIIGTFQGDLSGLVFTATNVTGCITMVLNSNGFISCASGSQTSWDYDVSCADGVAVTYAWTPDNGSLNDVNVSNPTIVNLLTTTTYSLAVYPIGHPDCVTTDDVIVSIGGSVDPGLDSIVTICKEAIEQNLFQYIGGTPELGGTWINPTGDTILMPILPDTLGDGLYEYKIDNAGCTASSFVDVTVSQITLSASINHSDCNAFNGEVTLIASANAVLPIVYSNDAGVTNVANDLFIEGYANGVVGALPTGMGSDNTYSFQVTDANGCIASIDSTVIDDNFPNIDINSVILTGSDCSANNGQVNTITVNGGTPNYIFSTDGLSYSVLTLTDLAPGNYDLIAQDNFGCTDTVQITILEINVPTVTATFSDVSCHSVGDGSINVSGNNLMSYSIDGGITTQTTGLFNNLIPGFYEVIGYSGPNGTLCSDTLTNLIMISEPAALQIVTLSSDLTVCNGDVITLDVSGSGGNGNYTYDWDYLGNNLGQGVTITATITNTMEVCVTMSEDCPSPSVDSCMTVSIFPKVYPKLTSDVDNGCFPLTVTLTNDSNNPLNIATSIWEFSDDNVSNPVGGTTGIIHTFQDPGVYNVYLEVTSSEGCIYDTTYSQFYMVHDHPGANFRYSTIPLTVYDSEASFTDYSTGDPIQWAWNFGSGAVPLTSAIQSPVVNYPQGIAGIYPTSLTVWNQYGCSDMLEGQVEVINDVTCFAPNIFTPDGDEFNETWRVYISGIDIYDFHVTMFNRWGEVVWESYDPNGEWDGSYASDGKIQDGSYVWILHAKDSYNDKKYEFNGTVSIAR